MGRFFYHNTMTNTYGVNAKWCTNSISAYKKTGEGVRLFVMHKGNEIAYFKADFDTDETGRRVSTFLHLFVTSEYRGQRLGVQLVSSLAHLAIRRGATHFVGSVESEHGLQVFHSLFGEHLTITDNEPGNLDIDFLLTYEQAHASLTRAAPYEVDLNARAIGVLTEIDLRGFEADQFHRPTELNQPLGFLSW